MSGRVGVNNGVSQELARKAVMESPDDSSNSIAKRLKKEHPVVFSSLGPVMLSVRRAKQELGYKPKRWVGMPKYIPKSKAKTWEHIELKAPCTVLSLSDIHVPYHDERAINVAVKHAKKQHKITVLLLNGDCCDFYSLSRFNTEKDKRDLMDELFIARTLLAWFKEQFPKCRRIFKRGNHEDWWDRYINFNALEMASCDFTQLGTALELEKHGFEEVHDNMIMAGELPILHGHEMKNSSGVNPARAAFLKGNHSSLSGHLHRTSSHSESDMFHKEIMTWTQGCLCGRRPEYARINKWNLGFAVVEVAKDKSYEVFNYRIGNNYTVRAA
jgi:predicted phosphodiesterase